MNTNAVGDGLGMRDKEKLVSTEWIQAKFKSCNKFV